MKLRVGLLFLAATLTACSVSVGEDITSSRKLHQNVRQSFALNPDGNVSIKNVAGSIDVTAWNKPQVELTVDKYGEAQSDLANTNVTIDRSQSDISINTQYRENRRGGLVEYRVRVPSGVKLRVENVSGPITVTGVSGALTARAVSGAIRATGLASDATVDSVSGGVQLRFTKVGQGQSITAKAVSGRIVIEMPTATSAKLTAKTVSGPIVSQFASVHTGRGNVGMTADGSIGRGDATLTLSTVSGSIDIDKAP